MSSIIENEETINSKIDSPSSSSFSSENNYSTDLKLTDFDYESLKVDEFVTINELDKEHLPYKIKSGKLPWYIYLMLVVEFAERASYYCCSDRLGNLVELPMPTNSKWGNVVKVNGVRPKDADAGALGKGLSKTNSITNFLSFTAYCFPLVASFVCDLYLRRMTMLLIGCVFGIVAHVVLMIAVIPGVLANPDTSYGLLYLGVLLLACCTACIKPVLLPLLLSQYKHETDVVVRDKKGDLVIHDRDLTLRRQTQWFYFAINIGSFISLGAGYLARDKGYFYAFLLPLLIFAIIPFVLFPLKNKVIDPPPAGNSILQDFFKVMKVAFEGNFLARIKNGTFWEYPKPSYLAKHQDGRVSWIRSKPEKGIYSERIVTDIKLTLTSSRIFLYWVIYDINDLGLSALTNNLSAAMKSNGVPNDVINNFNPIAIIVFTPILDYLIYPFLTKIKMNPNVTIRIFIGFMLAAGAMAGGAILQRMVYNRSVCGDYASTCDTQANISLWETCVIYGLTGIGETFAMVGGYQIAFVTSPSNMKSLVMAIFLFMNALSSIINIIISPSLKDPNLVKVFGAIAGIGAAFAFWWLYQYWNLQHDMEIIIADLMEYEKEMEAMEAKQQLDYIGSEEGIVDEKSIALDVNPVLSKQSHISEANIAPTTSALEATAMTS